MVIFSCFCFLPLRLLFRIDGVKGVFFGTDFITITKVDDDTIEWAIMKPEIYATIMDFFTSGLPVITDEQPSADTGIVETEVVRSNKARAEFHRAAKQNVLLLSAKQK